MLGVLDALHLDACSSNDSGERKEAVSACGTNARDSAHRVEQASEELTLLLIFLVAGVRELDPCGEYVIGAESWINSDEPIETADEQARSHEQKEGDCNFADDEDSACDPSTVTGTDCC